MVCAREKKQARENGGARTSPLRLHTVVMNVNAYNFYEFQIKLHAEWVLAGRLSLCANIRLAGKSTHNESPTPLCHAKYKYTTQGACGEFGSLCFGLSEQKSIVSALNLFSAY